VTMQRFAVEFKRRTVGVAVRLAGGFVFYASDKYFEEMDGRTFAKARAIESQLRKVAKRRKSKEPGFRSDPAFA
jgi:hypothetical protein